MDAVETPNENKSVRTFPHYVSIRVHGLQYPHFCSGSIIDKHWILTAAICIPIPNERDINDMHVVVGIGRGSIQGKRYALERYIVHPQFSEEYMANNIGLLKTKYSLKFDDRTQPIPISSAFMGMQDTAVVVGWKQVRCCA